VKEAFGFVTAVVVNTGSSSGQRRCEEDNYENESV
jgi:hypothetical protein